MRKILLVLAATSGLVAAFTTASFADVGEIIAGGVTEYSASEIVKILQRVTVPSFDKSLPVFFGPNVNDPNFNGPILQVDEMLIDY
jgi:hypothetical protein